MKPATRKNQFITVLATSFQTQLSVALGIFLSLVVSYFYLFINDSRFPKERPEVLWIGFGISFGLFLLGNFLNKKQDKLQPITIKQGTQIVFLTWLLSVTISTIIFVLSGFPVPSRQGDFSLFRRVVDAIFESISGYTTAGVSILPSVEVFPRSILMWRSVTHLLGGMGLSYLAITIWKSINVQREMIINSEAEGPSYTQFESENDARSAGFDFIKIYSLITGLMILLMLISGALFRQLPYQTWSDNAFDAVNYSFSTMGTGGFAPYDTSAGLPLTPSNAAIIGGLRNTVSEWIIAIFMMITGSNLGLWYILAFNTKKFKEVFTNKEFITYCSLVFGLTFSIWLILLQHNYYPNVWDTLRYAFFNVSSIISTTGLGNTNFHLWPAAAIAILFIPYLTGGMVGSTSGGLKTLRFMIMFRYVWMKIQNLVYGRHQTRFTIDKIRYDEKQAGYVVINIMVYYIIFLLGAVLIMITSPQVTLIDGTTKNIDLLSGITASISNLGNIGPTAALGGNVDAGPSGNYSAFSEGAKLVMSLLMFIGRIGVLSFLMLFITGAGMRQVEDSVVEKHFDRDEPDLK